MCRLQQTRDRPYELIVQGMGRARRRKPSWPCDGSNSTSRLRARLRRLALLQSPVQPTQTYFHSIQSRRDRPTPCKAPLVSSELDPRNQRRTNSSSWLSESSKEQDWNFTCHQMPRVVLWLLRALFKPSQWTSAKRAGFISEMCGLKTSFGLCICCILLVEANLMLSCSRDCLY